MAAHDPEPAWGRYLYAVCRAPDPSALAGVPGLFGAPLELIGLRDLLAVVSDVPMSSFGEQALHRNLEDVDWLEDVVRVHDDVVRAVTACAPTAPMRLATVFFDDEAVRNRLREWYVDLVHVLDRIHGCAEFSVKVLVPPDEPAARGAPGTSSDEPVSGADYLRRKQARAQARTAQGDAAAAAAHEVHDALAHAARASRRLPAQDPRLSGHRGTMVLNAAYLVADEQAQEFTDLLARLAAQASADGSVVVEGRGPWPPYSFAMLGIP